MSSVSVEQSRAAAPADDGIPAGGAAGSEMAAGGTADGGTAAGKRQVLLDAAARILAEEGHRAVSVRRVAAAAGTSTMAVYTWYGGKPQLMRALFREAFSRFRDRLLAESAGADPLAALIRLGSAYRSFALAEPDLYTVMFGRDSALFDPDPEDVRLALGTFEILVTAVSRCVEAGLLRCDPQQGAWRLWAASHGAVSLELAQGSAPGSLGGPDAGETFGGLMRTLLTGLGADEASIGSARQEDQD
jgi:AcrR family transcriptional regulator